MCLATAGSLGAQVVPVQNSHSPNGKEDNCRKDPSFQRDRFDGFIFEAEKPFENVCATRASPEVKTFEAS